MTKKRHRVVTGLVLTVSLVFCLAGPLVAGGDNSRILEIYGIDVGQGDAALVIFPYDGASRKTMLIDCGPSSGGSRVARLLDRLGISTVDIAVLSHFHADHERGFWNLGVPISVRYDRFNIGVGDVIYDDGAATATCVAANGRIIGGGYQYDGGNENTHSVVLWIKYLGFDYLTGGDLTGSPNIEGPLGDALADLGARFDVYKVNHHGSRYSSRLDFLQSIMPEFAMIFVGDNGYGHPTWDTLSRLNRVGVITIYQTNEGSGDTADNVTVANGQIHVVTDGLTYSFSNEGKYSKPFNDGPYTVDEPVGPTPTPRNTVTPTVTPTITPTPAPITEPPHLLITEVAIDTHGPEDHDWFELYLPPGAAPVDLSTLYWIIVDRMAKQLARNGPLTLSPGEVVILHAADGTDESDATGRGENGWWDLYLRYTGWGQDDLFVISTEEYDWPYPGDCVDAVVWSNDNGRMGPWWTSNRMISLYQWGDPLAGAGRFASDDEGPAIGDINDGYARRVDTEDTNSVADWIIIPSHSQGTPPPMAPIRVNFQPASSRIPGGYIMDDGSQGREGSGYGWQ